MGTSMEGAIEIMGPVCQALSQFGATRWLHGLADEFRRRSMGRAHSNIVVKMGYRVLESSMHFLAGFVESRWEVTEHPREGDVYFRE